jgi:segregation and condensation protein B
VTTREFLARFGFESLKDLPDMEQLEDAGLLNKANRMEKVRNMWDGLIAAEEGGSDEDDGEASDILDGAEAEDAVELDHD